MVVHTATDVLVIKRVDHHNFWQSVTGSLEWGENASDTAVRELSEETGISNATLRNTGIRRSYKIIEAWQHRYHPDVSRNYESLFYCQLDAHCQITLNPKEHSDYQWLPIEEARDHVYSWTNRLAIEALL